MTNRIIVPANYSIEVTVKLDPRTGQSELQIKNRSTTQISMMQVAGMLIEHAANLMRTLLTKGGIVGTPFETPNAPENQTEEKKVQ